MRRGGTAVAVAAMVAALGLGRAGAAPTIIRGFIPSFDLTPIVYNLFLPDAAVAAPPYPVVLQGHGWGGSGQTAVSGFLQRLLENGYAVLTWDSRGFGASGGEAHVDGPDFERHDTSALIDMLAARSDILLEFEGDPVMGMVGGSYAGGIQLVTAAFDSRVDAIVPNITWNDLRYSLFPGGVIKLGFDEALYALGLATSAAAGLDPRGPAGPQTGSYAFEIHRSEVVGAALGYADQETLDWFESRSLAGYGDNYPLAVPMLLTQGNSDTLFNINEAVATFDHVRANGAPAKLVIFCGGHVSCPYPASGSDHVGDATLAWLDRHVKGLAVSTGPAVEYITNDGVWHAAADFTTAASHTVNVAGSGTVIGSLAKSSVPPAVTYATPSFALDPGTLTIPTSLAGGDAIVGIPHATLTVSGIGPGGTCS